MSIATRTPTTSNYYRQDTREVIRKVWEDESSFALTLLTLFLDKYGDDGGLEWEPETIFLEIYDDYGIELPEASFNRLMTARQMMLSDLFYTSLPEFIHFCNVLARQNVRADVFDHADPLEIAWGLVESALIEPDPENRPAFSEEISAYVTAIMREEGLSQAPRALLGRDLVRSLPNSAGIGYAFADDPALFQAIWQSQEEKTTDIDDSVKSYLIELSDQLAGLPLRNGSVKVAEMLKQQAMTL